MNRTIISILTTCFLVSFSGCTIQNTNTTSFDNTISNNVNDNSEIDATEETALLGHIPQDMEFRNNKYKMVTDGFLELNTIELYSIIAYFINEKDYEMYISANSNIEYCIDKSNTIFYAFGEDKLPIYSIVGYSINDLVAVTFPQGGGSPLLFMNILL